LVATVDLAGAVLVVLLMAIPLLSGGLVVCNQCTNKAIRMMMGMGMPRSSSMRERMVTSSNGVFESDAQASRCRPP